MARNALDGVVVRGGASPVSLGSVHAHAIKVGRGGEGCARAHGKDAGKTAPANQPPMHLSVHACVKQDGVGPRQAADRKFPGSDVDPPRHARMRLRRIVAQDLLDNFIHDNGGFGANLQVCDGCSAGLRRISLPAVRASSC